jgi:hypothetical protein
MKTAVFPSFTSSAVRCLPMTAGGTWYGPELDPTIGSSSGGRILALVGLLVGILMLAPQYASAVWALPDMPSTVAYATTRLPLIMILGPDSRPILHGMRAHPVAVAAGRLCPPSDCPMPGDDDLDDDHSSPLAMLTAEVPSLTPAPAVRGVNGLKHAYLWPFRYLTRPQRLTRC